MEVSGKEGVRKQDARIHPYALNPRPRTTVYHPSYFYISGVITPKTGHDEVHQLLERSQQARRTKSPTYFKATAGRMKTAQSAACPPLYRRNCHVISTEEISRCVVDEPWSGERLHCRDGKKATTIERNGRSQHSHAETNIGTATYLMDGVEKIYSGSFRRYQLSKGC